MVGNPAGPLLGACLIPSATCRSRQPGYFVIRINFGMD